MSDSKQTDFLANFLAGGVGGSCGAITGQPFDTVKVRLQTQPKPKLGELPQFRGMIDCFKTTIIKEGFFGLYKGMGAPLLGAAPLFAIFFFGASVGRKIQQRYPDEVISITQTVVAGCFAGILTTAIMAPGDRIKCILQVQQGRVGVATPDVHYKGPVDVVKKLYREGGIRSIYRGTCVTLLRDVPASGAYLGSYEFLMRRMAGEDRKSLSPLATLTAGGLAGIANWAVAIMPDTLKSRLQAAPHGKYPDGIRSVFKELMREEGFLSLYKGFTPIMLRAFPANAACFMGYEIALQLLSMIGI